MTVSVAVLSVMTMLHALTLMAVMSVPVTLDSLQMDSPVLVRLEFNAFSENTSRCSTSII